MATHSSTLAWRVPWTEKPGGLPSMESQSRTQLSDSHTHTHIQARTHAPHMHTHTHSSLVSPSLTLM